MSGLPVGLRLLRPDGIEVEKRQLTGDRLGALSTELRLAARCAHRRVAGRAAARPESAADRHRRIPRRGFCPAAAQGRAVRRRRADPARRGVPGRCRRALLLRRARSRAGDRGRGGHRARRRPLPERSRASISAWPTRNLPAIAATSRRPSTDDDGKARLSVAAERSAGPDPAARRDDPGRRVRAERPRRLRDPDPADPAAPAGDRAALARRRRRGSGGQPRQSSR